MSSLPAVLHDSLLYKIVTVEMTNGLTATGRVVAFDKETMNVQLDAISHTEMRCRTSGHVIREAPPQLVAMSSLTIRGANVHSIDVTMPVVVDAIARAGAQAKASITYRDRRFTGQRREKPHRG